MTLELLLNTLCELAVKYNLINYAAAGPSIYALNSATIKGYPFIFISPTDEVVVRKYLTTYGLTIFYCDRLLLDSMNETQIFSVGIDTINNFIRQLRKLDGIVEIGDYSIRLFSENEKMNDRVNGAYARVNITVLNDLNCAAWFEEESEPVDPDTGSTPTPVTDLILLNSIYSTNPENNRMVLPFVTDADMEMIFSGEVLSNVPGICFGGNMEMDRNDFRWFYANDAAYYDCGDNRIELANADRGNIRNVRTYNYGFDITYEDGTVRSVTGTTLENGPKLDGYINPGVLRIRRFKVTLGNEVIYDGVPAKRRADGKLGLYDYVRGWFTLPQRQRYLAYD